MNFLPKDANREDSRLFFLVCLYLHLKNNGLEESASTLLNELSKTDKSNVLGSVNEISQNYQSQTIDDFFMDWWTMLGSIQGNFNPNLGRIFCPQTGIAAAKNPMMYNGRMPPPTNKSANSLQPVRQYSIHQGGMQPIQQGRQAMFQQHQLPQMAMGNNKPVSESVNEYQMNLLAMENQNNLQNRQTLSKRQLENSKLNFRANDPSINLEMNLSTNRQNGNQNGMRGEDAQRNFNQQQHQLQQLQQQQQQQQQQQRSVVELQNNPRMTNLPPNNTAIPKPVVSLPQVSQQQRKLSQDQQQLAARQMQQQQFQMQMQQQVQQHPQQQQQNPQQQQQQIQQLQHSHQHHPQQLHPQQQQQHLQLQQLQQQQFQQMQLHQNQQMQNQQSQKTSVVGNSTNGLVQNNTGQPNTIPQDKIKGSNSQQLGQLHMPNGQISFSGNSDEMFNQVDFNHNLPHHALELGEPSDHLKNANIDIIAGDWLSLIDSGPAFS